MSSEVDRLKRLDEENEFLGSPLTMPDLPKKDGKDASWDVYLRAPKRISSTPSEGLLGELLATYNGSDPYQALYLGMAKEQKDYAGDVLKLFPREGESTSTKETLRGPRGEVAIQRYTYDDNSSSLSINFYKEGTTQVVVVFRVQKDGLTGVSKSIDLSLTTLAVGPAADRMRQRSR